MTPSRKSGVQRDALALFLFGVSISILLGALYPFALAVQSTTFESIHAARTLALTGTLANPYAAGPTGPTAHLAPVFPAIAAALFHLPVDWRLSLLAFAAILSGINAALMPWFSELLLGSRGPGRWGGAMLALSMPFVPQGETVLSSVLCIYACISILEASRFSWVFCGLSCLTNPVTAIPVMIFALRSGPRLILSSLAGIVVVCFPWILRDRFELGAWVPIRDNFGLEMAVSNNDCATVSLGGNAENDCLNQTHPSRSIDENRRVLELGEVRYNKVRMHEALNWISGHRKRFAWLTLGRAREYFFPFGSSGAPLYVIWIATAAVFVALAWRIIPAVGPLQLSCLVLWIPYLFVQMDQRYRSAALWAWMLLAGAVIEWIETRAPIQAGWSCSFVGLKGKNGDEIPG